MYFGFDDDQLAFRDAVRDLLDKECTPATVRAAWDAPAGDLDRGVWDRLSEMGVLATLVPEAADGLGLDEQALVLVLEEAGRAGLPHPLVETAAVAAPLVAGGAGPRPAGVPDAHGLGMVASDLGGPHVPCAADADWLLLRDPQAGALHLVDPAATVLTPVDTVDRGRRAATVDWQPTPETVVTDDPAAVARALDRGAFGAAALLVGLGQRMLDLTVAYVTERRQFGVPIGSFQAVKHHLADALKELAFARPAVHRAAHSLATDADTRTPRRVDGQGHGVGRRLVRGPPGPPVPWRHRLHRRARPPAVPEAHLGARPVVGHPVPAPHPSRRIDRHLTAH